MPFQFLINNVRRAGASIANASKRGLSRLLPYRPMSGGHQLLDTEYSSGVWDYLRGLDELSRFSVVAGYCHFLKDQGSILEIGCGEGLLHQRLDKRKYARYLGVDISTEAIRRAAGQADEKAEFVAEDALVFSPRQSFDAIIFNECLEYFTDPLNLVRQYEPFLNGNGVFIISMFVGLDTARTKQIWRRLQTVYRVLDETQVCNVKRYRWIIKVLAPVTNP